MQCYISTYSIDSTADSTLIQLLIEIPFSLLILLQFTVYGYGWVKQKQNTSWGRDCKRIPGLWSGAIWGHLIPAPCYTFYIRLQYMKTSLFNMCLQYMRAGMFALCVVWYCTEQLLDKVWRSYSTSTFPVTVTKSCHKYHYLVVTLLLVYIACASNCVVCIFIYFPELIVCTHVLIEFNVLLL